MKFLRVVISLAVMGAVVVIGCQKDQYTVEYRVSGKSSTAFAIDYVSNSAGDTTLTINAALPWTYSFSADRGDTVYVRAWCSDSVNAKIYIDGDLKAQDWDESVAEVRCVVE